jgi:hypothetical protein
MKLEDKNRFFRLLKKNADEEIKILEIILVHYRNYFNKLLDEIEDADILPIIKEINKTLYDN